jgi:hypothetical protein
MEEFSGRFKLLLGSATFALVSALAFSQTLPSNENTLRQLMQSGEDLQEKGDLLSSSAIFSYVRSYSMDSTTQAEAIYRYISCGDAQASVLNAQDLAFNKLNWSQGNDPLKSELRRIRDLQIASFLQVGIVLQKVEHYYFVNADTISRQLLTTKYKYTPWGELATYALITNELSSKGLPAFNDPNEVLSRALTFMHDYPHSEYENDVHVILGKAYQDLWNCFHNIDYSHLLTPDQRENPGQLRKEAIKHLELASNHRKNFKKEQWDNDLNKVLKKLREKQETYIFYYFDD